LLLADGVTTEVPPDQELSESVHQGADRDATEDIWGPRTPHVGSWPIRVDEHVTETPTRWVQSACVLCSYGCGLDVGVRDGRIVGVRGRAVDRVNHGRLGPKGMYGWQANASADRLTRPLVKRDGKHVPVSWDEAMDLVVTRSREVIERYTPGAMAFYNSGQLFLEDYYTLAIVAEGGVGTAHVDGNTRLCTATAAMALIESFGSDGGPGSYADYDITDCIFLIGHNMASTQTVLWSRILDRLAGPKPPKLIVVDPRFTEPAKKATIHLRPKLGTNLALMNGLVQQVIEQGGVDKAWVDAHAQGYDELAKIVRKYSPNVVEEITGVPAAQLRAAGRLLATTPTLVSSCLQGVYQSMNATATAVAVNNLHLLRGLIGKPGSTVFQMNGQPTAQNTRECGANGEMIAFRNWNNEEHMEQIARIWNVDKDKIPHWSPPTHIMEIFRYAEQGSIRFLWVIGTNPAVSLPELHRIRKILAKDDLFLVVSDAFMTETAALADVVLPVALWGEKTGTFTNADRTVHISQKAIEPPGEAKPDMDILLDYSRRMGFTDKDGAPLIKWSTPEECFEAFKEITRGRPCDYTGLTYEKLSEGSGIQWPCNERHPNGKERLYEDGRFTTSFEDCELFGHDLETGAAIEPEEYRAKDAKGKARLKGAHHTPPLEQPNAAYPLWLTTGRVPHHFHTRTKTGRAPELQKAAPEVFVQLSETDASARGISEGDLVEAASARGSVRGPARIGDIEPGHVFVPFHYGYWDDGADGYHRAANELTRTSWDPVSKQPHLKFAAVQLKKVGS
jgi:ferredoxin-nitrate reductase